MHTIVTSLLFLFAATHNINAQTENTQTPQLITNQFASLNPTDMNPTDYENKIENTVYQSGDRLIVIQSIPIKYIKEATEPNIQPTINDFPSF